MQKRVYIEKKPVCNEYAEFLKNEITLFIGVPIISVRVLYGYEINTADFKEDDKRLLYNPVTEHIFDSLPEYTSQAFIFGSAALPGQYDERGCAAAELFFAVKGCKPDIKSFVFYIIEGDLTAADKEKIKRCYINPTDAYELEPGAELRTLAFDEAKPVKTLNGFIQKTPDEAEALRKDLGLSLSANDFMFIHAYFKEDENRDPTETEIRILDAYWSDHCRHTTFLTHIDSVAFEDGPYNKLFKDAYELYLQKRDELNNNKHITLMDLASVGMKTLKNEGRLHGLDESDEINACSVNIKINAGGTDEDWLLMFKNETHNHPTEIEPFGGAATCLGGAIRDPLAGRAYVYQAMRVTGSADPRSPYGETIPGKIPQRMITRTAAKGYSSYGNAVGVPAGLVNEIYHEGYAAKRMELGAVVGAVKKENVRRFMPEPGDVVLLVGGRTGRDGIGAAAGSSVVQNADTIQALGTQVQKGCPAVERNILRLFRQDKAAKMIKRCNDFGAGGVAVAVGELADGLCINLDNVPSKYPGLDGTELAISESQERMAVVVSPIDEQAFIKAANEENLECTRIAVVTKEKRLVMKWRGTVVCDMSRAFLNTSGVSHNESAGVFIASPKKREVPVVSDASYLLPVLSDLNVAAQKGLTEEFDCGGALLAPLGGVGQFTPIQAMAARIPALNCETVSIMAYGYDPYLFELSPFHGAVCAVVDSIAKVMAAGARQNSLYLSFQEYFERLGNNESRWGKPFAALLGGFYAQMKLGIASIGGKDSMSGTFKDVSVPPALVSFAIGISSTSAVISPEFKLPGNEIALLETKIDKDELPDMESFLYNICLIERLIKEKKIISAYALGAGGVAAAAAKMSFGNFVGVKLNYKDLFGKKYGSFIVEAIPGTSAAEGLKYIGETTKTYDLNINGLKTEISVALAAWLSSLEGVFPTNLFEKANEADYTLISHNNYEKKTAAIKTTAPKVFIPILPGTNGDFELSEQFAKNGGRVAPFVLKTAFTYSDYTESVNAAAKQIKDSQILALPAGGDYKFISAFLETEIIKDAINTLLTKNDGLVLGIANGFAALLESGLVNGVLWQKPEIAFAPNEIGRHICVFTQVKVIGNNSPWLARAQAGEIYVIQVSADYGRLTANDTVIKKLAQNGQAAMQYVDLIGTPKADIRYNPSGSAYALCALSDPSGKVLGIQGRPEYTQSFKNIPGNKDLKIFEAGLEYFK